MAKLSVKSIWKDVCNTIGGTSPRRKRRKTVRRKKGISSRRSRGRRY